MFDKRLRYWYLCVALFAYTNFAFYFDERLRSDFRKSKKERKEKIKKSSPTSRTLFCRFLPAIFLLFILIFVFFSLIIIIIIWINYFYYFIRVHFYSEKFYFFSVHLFEMNFNSRHFLTSKIFVKILSLKSLVIYHPEIRKIF